MSKDRLYLEGKHFGRLTVLRYLRTEKNGAHYLCQCVCGKQIDLSTGNLRGGNTKSCGCLKKELVAKKNFRHGLLRRGQQSREFYAYLNAKKRCTNQKDKRWKDYGGRGIQFKFKSFEEFLGHIGSRPSADHSLDRKNNDGHYELGNVRWATRSQQQRNRRDSVNRSLHPGRV